MKDGTITLNVCVETDKKLEEFEDLFVKFIESNGMCFGGSIQYTEIPDESEESR